MLQPSGRRLSSRSVQRQPQLGSLNPARDSNESSKTFRARVAIGVENELDLAMRRAHDIDSGTNNRRCASEVSARARLTFPVDDLAMSRVETFLSAFTAQHGLRSDDRLRALIVLEELITNLLKYGYNPGAVRGLAELQMALEPGPRLMLELIDDGNPFDPFSAPVPDMNQPVEDRLVGGLGLHLVRTLTEGRRYHRLKGHNVTRLILRVERSQPL
jgi:serine/threonine-protein kinase RsbW